MNLTKYEQELNNQNNYIVKIDYCFWDECDYWRIWNVSGNYWETKGWFTSFEAAQKEVDKLNNK